MEEYNKQYYKDNLEHIKQYCIDNKEHRKENSKQYCLDHPEYEKQRHKQYRKDHPEYKKQYYKTPTGKLSCQKSEAKRRELGFIPLNEPFVGSVAHHISQNFVIYMPKELHQNLYHNIWTWENMEQMNKLAIEFL